MQSFDLNGIKVLFYDDPAQLPIVKYFEYQFYMSLALSINPDTIPTMFSELETYIANNETDKALKQVQNIKISYSSALNKTELKSLCIGQLLHKIGDQVVDYTHSEQELKDIIRDLSDKGFTKQHIDTLFDSLKKKFVPSLNSGA